LAEKTSTELDRTPVQPIPVIAGIAVFILLLLLPAPEGLSQEGWRVVAVASLMIIWWITEAIPVPATALVPIALFPLTGATTGGAATAPYGDPIIFLFMGGFVLALAMERWNLHRRIALNIVARTGTQQGRIVGGFMIATAFCSMWVSNTATVVMMLPVALSVIGLLSDDKQSSFPLSLLLGVAYAASIGGVATLIGTPPNALLAGTLNQVYGYDIGFARWMIIGVPLAVVMLAVSWVLLTRITLKLDKGEVAGAADLFRSELGKLGAWSTPEKRVAIIFVATAFAWIFRTVLADYVPGLNDTSIAIVAAILLFLVPAGDGKGGALIEWRHALRLPWGVLLLFGGGLSLAAAVVSTGLDEFIGGQLGNAAAMLPLIAVIALVATVILSAADGGAGRIARGEPAGAHGTRGAGRLDGFHVARGDPTECARLRVGSCHDPADGSPRPVAQRCRADPGDYARLLAVGHLLRRERRGDARLGGEAGRLIAALAFSCYSAAWRVPTALRTWGATLVPKSSMAFISLECSITPIAIWMTKRSKPKIS
jgi:solute carrier family 13 (sodium-dependent dicarboxylate transporter), member 2/3/5